MPELPDIADYIEALKPRILNQSLEQVRVFHPFLLRTAEPPIAAVEGKRILALKRLGKRICFGLEDELWLVLHLMIAGRLAWKEPGATPNGRNVLAAFDFVPGTLILTEAGTKRRASLHLVQGAAALADHDPGGLEVLEAEAADFAARLIQANHTLKRALTDPRLFAGIGNAYSDEILHWARLSPVAMTQGLTEVERHRLYAATQATLIDWTQRLRAETGDDFPAKVTAFRPRWRSMAAMARPAPIAARRFSASATLTTRPTTARAARPAARSWPTGPCRVS